ncbi:hypothetical protein C8R45DRAFT_1151977 [Mycena sanguinolenta]|nr:hypothetical protein C8R45DRAFT_1151977 [Mycena sanguinolenta]
MLWEGGPPLPHSGSLLYSAMGLRPPASDQWPFWPRNGEPLKWVGLLLSEEKKTLMALLLAHGATKDGVMKTISKHLATLAAVAQHTEEEYLDVIAGMFKEAEDTIPVVLQAGVIPQTDSILPIHSLTMSTTIQAKQLANAHAFLTYLNALDFDPLANLLSSDFIHEYCVAASLDLPGGQAKRGKQEMLDLLNTPG